MKKLVIAISAVAAMTGSAVAADMPTKAAVAPSMARAMSWTGCYVGAGGGYGMSNQETTVLTAGGVPVAPTATFGGRGYFGTVQGGCDYQFAPNWVVGAFGDFDFGSIKGTPSVLGFVGEAKQSSSWAAGGRVGYVVVPQLLAYVSGGFTQAHFDTLNVTGTTFSVASYNANGWFLGSGYEYNLNWFPGLTWKTEYRYADYRNAQNSILSGGVPTGFVANQHNFVQTIRSELVYRFWAH